MSTTYRCESCGSQSATSDYCDTCGAAIFGSAGGAAGSTASPGASPPASPGPSPVADVIDPPDIVDPPDRSRPADMTGVKAMPTAVPASGPAASGPGAAPPGTAGATCYFCGAPRDPDDTSCEVCGLDFASGSPRVVAPVDPTPVPGYPVPPTGWADDSLGRGTPPAVGDTMVAGPSQWTVQVGADRAFFDGNVTAGVVTFPDGLAPRAVPLTGSEVSIGRRSESKGYVPDIDLSSPVDDPAVSRRHAVLRRMDDGSWAVLDLGSTNGTWLNDEDEPLPHNVPRPLRHGDRLLLGAFSCITITNDAPNPS